MAVSRKKLRIGSVGIGGMGNGHLGAHAANKRVKIVALCDLIPEKCEQAIIRHNLDPKTPSYTDFRELIDKEKLDQAEFEAIMNAAPAIETQDGEGEADGHEQL